MANRFETTVVFIPRSPRNAQITGPAREKVPTNVPTQTAASVITCAISKVPEGCMRDVRSHEIKGLRTTSEIPTSANRPITRGDRRNTSASWKVSVVQKEVNMPMVRNAIRPDCVKTGWNRGIVTIFQRMLG